MVQPTQSQIRASSVSTSLPKGIRILAQARAIRWIGWGLGEALVPIFLLKFSATYLETGILSSTMEIMSLISLPLIGALADSIAAKRLILVSLLLYPLVGASYFLAGTFGIAIFVVIARALNGVTWELENVGVETYYRRTSHSDTIGTSFGYLDTLSTSGWIAAALVGMFLIRSVPLHYLLLAIAPFSMVAFLIVVRLPVDLSDRFPIKRSHFLPWAPFQRLLREWKSWDSRLWKLGLLTLFASLINGLVTFFLPIDTFLHGGNFQMVVLVGILGMAPSLFGYKLGLLADRGNKRMIVVFSLLAVAIFCSALAIFSHDWLRLVTAFTLGIILELLVVIKSSLITTLGPQSTFGIRGSAFETIVTVGDLLTPILLGFAVDVIGFSNTLSFVAGGSILIALIYYSSKRDNAVISLQEHRLFLKGQHAGISRPDCGGSDNRTDLVL